MGETCPECGSTNTIGSTSGSYCYTCGAKWIWVTTESGTGGTSYSVDGEKLAVNRR